MARKIYFGLILAGALLALPITAPAKDAGLSPAMTKRLRLLGEGAYFSGYCSKYITEESQKDVAAMINGDGMNWPPGQEDAKAKFVSAMQGFYMKGLGETKQPKLSQQSCMKILTDISNEIAAIKD